jgi:hypothetical protein
MRGFIGGNNVANYVNTTSGEAQYVRALFGLGGNHVRVRGLNAPAFPSHIITETTDQIIDSESSEQFITET